MPLVKAKPGIVTEMTSGPVSGNMSWMHIGGAEAKIIGTTDATPPSIADFEAGIIAKRGDGRLGDSIDGIFVGAGFTRLWALVQRGGANFSVWHA